MKIENLNMQELKTLKESPFPLHSIWPSRFKHYYKNSSGFVATAQVGDCLVLAGDPVLNSENHEDFFLEMSHDCHLKKMQFCGYYFSEEVAGSVKSLKFLKAGTSSFLKVNEFNLHGNEHRDIRRAQNYWNRIPGQVLEVIEPEKSTYLDRVKGLREKWLSTRAGLEVEFLLGHPEVHSRGRWFTLMVDSELRAFISIHSYGENCWYLDHMIFDPIEGRFAIDHLLTECILRLQGEGSSEFCLGFNAFDEVNPGYSAMNLMMWLKSKNNFFYNNKGLKAFKKKYTDFKKPRYILLKHDQSALKTLPSLVRVTYPNLSF